MAPAKQYWLLKSEPSEYSIDDLARDGLTAWDGVRNYQARNYLRDEMQQGDAVLFYHSNARPPGVAGMGRVCRTAYPDPTAWTPGHPRFDPRSTQDQPVWFVVDIEFVEKFRTFIPLEILRAAPELEGLAVRRRGQRLSIQPVSPAHFHWIVDRGREPGPAG